MPNYRQTDISGSKYTRSNRVILENPYQATPSATFLEEDVITFDSQTIKKPSGVINQPLSDPNTVFNVLNPTDDSIINTATYQDIYVLVYSLYRHLAAIRDG